MAIGIGGLTSPADAQPPGPPPTRPVDRPDGALSASFSLIRSVRELADGRVLVTDWIDEKLLVADFAGQTTTQLGRLGAGPKEYRLPGRLVALPGDTTLLIDVGNQRLTVVDPGPAIIGTLAPPGELPFQVSPRGVDRAGGLYYSIPNWTKPGAAPDDSVDIARWDRRSKTVAIVAKIRGSTPPPERPDRRSVGIPFVMYAPSDAWGTLADGSLYLLRSPDYHLEVVSPAGPRLHGPSHRYQTRPVTAADRTAAVRAFLATAPMSGRGPGGHMGHTPASFLADSAVRRMVANNSFAQAMPYFDPDGVWPLPTGGLLVRRTSGAEPVVFDRLDDRGHLIERLTLPSKRSLVGVGSRHLYLVTTDEDGLQRLERYPLEPRGGRP